jgi:hypothetical protein
MVFLSKSFIAATIATIAIAPALAAPLQVGQDDVELSARDPWMRGIRRTLRRVNLRRITRGIGAVARVARFIPGPIGMAAGVASRIIRRDAESELYTRAVQDELDARGYDIELDLREVEGLEARDISSALSARDNIYAIRARAFVDEMEAEARDLGESPYDELD